MDMRTMKMKGGLLISKPIMHIDYMTEGTCSKAICFDIDANHTVTNLQFVGGCPGNTIGIAQLAEGMKAEDLIARLRGVRCGMKRTSCPDQLATALAKAVSENRL